MATIWLRDWVRVGLQVNTINVIRPMLFFGCFSYSLFVDGWQAQRFVYLGRWVIPQVSEVFITLD